MRRTALYVHLISEHGITKKRAARIAKYLPEDLINALDISM